MENLIDKKRIIGAGGATAIGFTSASALQP